MIGGMKRALESALPGAALRARKRAYAPYSRFKVGAAVLADGQVFSGCNVENASYGLAICAERSAIVQAVAAGKRRVEAVAIATGTSPPTPPCGMCLQTFAEFGRWDMAVVLCGARGERVRTTLRALLPHGFSRKYL